MGRRVLGCLSRVARGFAGGSGERVIAEADFDRAEDVEVDVALREGDDNAPVGQ